MGLEQRDQGFLLNFQVQKLNLRFLSRGFQLPELGLLKWEKRKGKPGLHLPLGHLEECSRSWASILLFKFPASHNPLRAGTLGPEVSPPPELP